MVAEVSTDLIERLCELIRRAIPWSLKLGRDRELPWRRERDPYKVLIAEILLRRTQGRKVVATYLELVKKYPTPRELADADVEELRRILQPLGLHNIRSRELKALGRELVERFGGEVPRELNELLSLPGVGEYVARAVRVLAFNLKDPLVDTNVIRVVSRISGIELKQQNSKHVKFVRDVLSRVIEVFPDAKRANLALLDFAAVICRARNPRCSECFARDLCTTYAKCVKSTK